MPARIIGKTGGSSITIRVGGQAALTLSVAEAEHVWATSIEERLAKRETAAVAYRTENGDLRFKDPAGHTLAAGVA